MDRRDDADIIDLFRRVKRFADAVYPDNLGAALVVKLPGGASAEFPISAAAAGAVEQPPGLSELETAIVDAIDGLEANETMTGDEVAERAGYPFNGRFREALAGLVRRGKIRNRRPGYSAP